MAEREIDQAGVSGMRYGIVHHMGRRCRTWDYHARCIYMITVTLQDADRRREWLGRLAATPRGETMPCMASRGETMPCMASRGETMPCMASRSTRESPVVVGATGVRLRGRYAWPGNLAMLSPNAALSPGAAFSHTCEKSPGEKSPAAPWAIEPTAHGAAVLDCWCQIAARWPGVALVAEQLMPDHFHGILFVKDTLPRPLGEIIRGFKIGCTKAWSRLGSEAPQWADGFVDLILWRDGQLEKMIAYTLDNPRRLAERRRNPALFRVVRDLPVPLVGAEGRCGIGHFSALGNHHLLQAPLLAQVQCSRSLYARDRPARQAPDGRSLPARAGFTTSAFEEKAADLLAVARHGAVLVSPCISDGEKEIARRAFAENLRLIVLQNKGFAPFQKPGGAYFDACAKGRLLLLSPAAWPFVPGRKPVDRVQSCVLNSIAQTLCGEGAATIDYKGVVPERIERWVGEAVRLERRPEHPDGKVAQEG